jgi:hypothetical protein
MATNRNGIYIILVLINKPKLEYRSMYNTEAMTKNKNDTFIHLEKTKVLKFLNTSKKPNNTNSRLIIFSKLANKVKVL